MSQHRILFITQEIAPYLPDSENSVLGRKLPQKAQEAGFEVRTFMPKFGSINERRNQLHDVIRLSGLNIPIDDADHPLIIKVASLQSAKIQVYFIDSDDFFQKAADDADPAGSNRPDNDERAIFFARGTMETVKKLRWEPEIVLCSGWITAFAPMYLRRMYADDPSFAGAKIIYNLIPGNSLSIDPGVVRKLKADGVLPDDTPEPDALDAAQFHRMAIDFADAVIVSTPEPDNDIMNYVDSKKIPVLNAAGLDAGDPAFAEFYRSVFDNEA